MRTNEVENAIDEITKWEEKIKRKDLKYKTSFGDSIYTCEITIVEAEEDQSNLINNIVEFNDKSRTKSKMVKIKKEILIGNIAHALYEGWESTFNAFKSLIFPLKSAQAKGFKILTPKDSKIINNSCPSKSR